MRTLVLLVLSAVAVACGPGQAETAAAAPEGAMAFRVALDRPPRAHSFDGGLTQVPWPPGRDASSIPFGELGRGERTGLYLTFEGRDLADELAAQPEGWSADARELEPAAGRFGRGARLSARSLVRCAMPEVPPERRTWTVECWLSPESFAHSTLLELPGSLRVETNRSGRLFTRVPGAGEPLDGGGFADLVVGSEGTLVEGEWNHLGVVLDLFELGAVRIVLNGAVQGRRFPPERAPDAPRELRFGDARGEGRGADVLVDELRVELRNLSTAELTDHYQSRPRALERLVLEYADGAREELDAWSELSTGPRIEGREAWARGELVRAIADEGGLAWTPEGWRRIRTPEWPLARTTHATTSIGGQRLLLYGGETRDTHFGWITNTDDTWIFDGGTERWTRVPTTRAPSGRCHVPMAYSPDHDAVLLVGGWFNVEEPGEHYRDTWLYSVPDGDWEPRSSDGLTRRTAVDHALVYLPAKRAFLMVVKPDNYLYSPDEDTWTRLPRPKVVDEHGEPTEDPPSFSRSAVVDSRGQVFLFGGYRDEFLATTAIFDPERNTMTVLHPEVHPSARVRPGFAYDPVRDRVVLFGGVRDQLSTRFEDLWVFEFATRTWREIPRGQGRPSARGGYYGMDHDPVADRFVLTHGRHASARFLDETWALELDGRRAGRARHVFDRREHGAAGVWSADVDAPGDARVTFRFRGGDDPYRLGAWRDGPPEGVRYVEVETELVPGSGGEVPRVRSMGFDPPR